MGKREMLVGYWPNYMHLVEKSDWFRYLGLYETNYMVYGPFNKKKD